MIGHLFFEPIRVFLLGIGGITRWILFQFINRVFDKDFPTDLDHYRNNKSIFVDKSGLTIAQKNMMVSFIIIIVMIVMAEKLES